MSCCLYGDKAGGISTMSELNIEWIHLSWRERRVNGVFFRSRESDA
jgi:hypothetical protein